MKKIVYAFCMLGAVLVSGDSFASTLCGCPLKNSGDRTIKNPCGDKSAAQCGGVCFFQDGSVAEDKSVKDKFLELNNKVSQAKDSGDTAAYDAAVKAQAQFMSDNKISGGICKTFAIGMAVSEEDPLGMITTEEEDLDFANSLISQMSGAPLLSAPRAADSFRPDGSLFQGRDFLSDSQRNY